MDVKIVRKDKSLPMPQYHTDQSIGFDLYCSEDAKIEPCSMKLVKCNNVVDIPENYALFLVVRSSTPKRKGLTLANNVGVIDPDYSGDNDVLGGLFYNFTDKVVRVEKGERLIQGIFVPVLKPNFVEVDSISDKDRGGFGSTGK